MGRLNLAEYAELLLILLLVVFVVWWFAPQYQVISLARLCLWLSVLLLSQSLIRDSWLLWHKLVKRQSDEKETVEPLSCMCIESTVGAVGVLVGIILALSGFEVMLELGSTGWGVSVFLVLAVGFLVKDWLFGWQPWRLLRDKDHKNIVFLWKP